MKKNYIIPKNADIILYDGGENNVCFGKVYPTDKNKNPYYGIRKNGNSKHPWGMPINYSGQTWVVLPDVMGEYIENGIKTGDLKIGGNRNDVFKSIK